jgi:PKD repeat protein
MNQKSQQLESLLRGLSEKYSEAPSPGVLRKIKFRLWLSDFFSTNFSKLNFIYSSVIIGGVVTAVLLTQKDENINRLDSFTEIAAEIPEIETTVNSEPISAGTVKESMERRREEASGGELLTAMFISESSKSCAPAEIKFYDKSLNAVSWRWDFGNGDVSEKQNPEYTFRKPGKYEVTLTVKDKKGNRDVFLHEIEILKKPVASLEIDRENSDIASRRIQFTNNSENASGYFWDFGDNKYSELPQPSHVYSDFDEYRVKLVARSSNGCSDTAVITNKFISKNYELVFPVYFKPNPFERNNNGFYEISGNEAHTFYPTNFGAKEYSFTVYTLNGIKVFETNNIKQGWNGYFGGSVAPGGFYNYVAKGIYPNGKPFEIKGRVKVIIDDYYYKF